MMNTTSLISEVEFSNFWTEEAHFLQVSYGSGAKWDNTVVF